MSFFLNSKIIAGLKAQTGESVYFSAISMGTVLIVGNFLEPDYFGVYTALYVVVSMLSEVSDIGFKNIIIRENSDDARMQKLLLYLVFNSLVMVAIYELFIMLYSNYLPGQVLWYQQLFGLLIILMTLNNYHTAVLRKKFKFKWVASIRVLGLTIGFLVTSTLIIVYDNFLGLLVGALMGEFIKLAIYSYTWEWKKMDLNLDIFSEARNAFGIYLSHLLGYLARNVDYLIISLTLGTKELGLYAIAYKLMQAPVKQLGGVVNKVMFPIYGNMSEREEVEKTFLFLINTVIFYSTIVFTIFFTVTDSIIAIFFQPEWEALLDVLSIMTVGGVFLLIHNFTEPLLKKHAKQSSLVIRQLIYLLSTVLFVYVGSMYGLQWAVIGVVSSLIMMAVVSMSMALTIINKSKVYLLLVSCVLVFLAIVFFLLNTSVLFYLHSMDPFINLFIVLLIDSIVLFGLLFQIGKNNSFNLHNKIYIPFKEKR